MADLRRDVPVTSGAVGGSILNRSEPARSGHDGVQTMELFEACRLLCLSATRSDLILEIEWLFERLKRAAQADDLSFFAARRAEHEFRYGTLVRRVTLSTTQVRKPPIFSTFTHFVQKSTLIGV